MEWLTQNWIWLALGIGVIWMFSHGGHGGGCGGGGHGGIKKSGQHGSTPAKDTSGSAVGHQHR